MFAVSEKWESLSRADGNWEAAESLRAVRQQRNRFEHFEATEPAEAVIASTAEALGVILDFIRDEFSDHFTDSEEALLKAIRGRLTDLDTFVETRIKSIAPELEAAYAVLPCPLCQQDVREEASRNLRPCLDGPTDYDEPAAQARSCRKTA